MACTVQVIDLQGGKLAFSPIVVSDPDNIEVDLQEGLTNQLNNFSVKQLDSTLESLDKIAESGSINTTGLYEIIPQSYSVGSALTYDTIQDYVKDSNISKNIEDKIKLLNDLNRNYKFLLIDADETYMISNNGSQNNFEGSIITDSNGTNYILLRNTDDVEKLANTMNHELTHVLMDRVILENEELQKKLTALFNDIKGAGNNSRVKAILNNLKANPRPTEIYAWVWGDQELYDLAKGSVNFSEINSIVDQTPMGVKKNNISVNFGKGNKPSTWAQNSNNNFATSENPFPEGSEQYDAFEKTPSPEIRELLKLGDTLILTKNSVRSALAEKDKNLGEKLTTTGQTHMFNLLMSISPEVGNNPRKKITKEDLDRIPFLKEGFEMGFALYGAIRDYNDSIDDLNKKQLNPNNPSKYRDLAKAIRKFEQDRRSLISTIAENYYGVDLEFRMNTAFQLIDKVNKGKTKYSELFRYEIDESQESTKVEPLKYSEDMPFALSYEEVLTDFSFAESNTLKELLHYKKDRSLEDLKKNNEEIHEHLMKDYNDRLAKGTLSMEYEPSRNTEGDGILLHGAVTGDIVQIPIMESKKWSTWKEYLNPEQMNMLFGDKTYDPNEYVNVSMRKIHELFNDYQGEKSDKLNKLLKYIKTKKDSGPGSKALWEYVKNYPLVYTVNNNNNPQVRVPYTLKSKSGKVYKTLMDFSFSDVIGIRKFKGNFDVDVEANLKSNKYANDKAALDTYLKELNNPVEYTEGFNFQDDDYEFIKSVIHTRRADGGKFQTSVVQGKNIQGIKGGIGSMGKILSTIGNGAFIKFANKWDTKEKKWKMQHGRIIASGASAVVVLYKDGQGFKTETIPHYKVTEVFIPSNTNQDFFDELNESDLIQFNKDSANQVKSERSAKFKELMTDLYKNRGKNVTMYNFEFMSNQAVSNGKDMNNVYETRERVINKVNTGSVVKYCKLNPDGSVTDHVGTFMFTDGGFSYVEDGFGNAIKILNKNSVGKYDTISKKRSFDKFKDDNNNSNQYNQNIYALDVVFSDMTRETDYVNYLKGLKLIIKSSYDTETSPDETVEQSLEKQLNDGSISYQEHMKLFEMAGQDNLKSIDEAVDIVEFASFKTAKQGTSTILAGDIEELMDDTEKRKQVAKLREGDLVHYYAKYDGNKIFRNWAIVTDFDYETGLPVIAYEREGRVRKETIKVENIKAVGYQINPINSGNLQVKGRPEILKKREELKKQYVDSKSGIMSFEEAKQALEKNLKGWKDVSVSKGGRSYEKGKVKFEIYPLAKETDSNGNSFYTKKLEASVAEVNANGDAQRWGVRKHYLNSSGEWDKGWSLSKYQLEMNEVFNAYEYDFEDIKAAAKYGTILHIEKNYKKEDGTINKKPYQMMVEKTTSTAILGRVLYTSKDGNVESFPMNVYKTGKVDTKIWSVYNADSRKLSGKNRNPENKGKSITQIKKSEFVKGFSKSKDRRQEISSAVSKLANLYDVSIDVLSNSDMLKMGAAKGLDLMNARGIVLDGKIYINADKASVAEAFHEMGHLIVPGLKAMNPKAWEVISQKVAEHPLYSVVAENYPNLSETDLVEEAFMSIFGEYYRDLYLNGSSEQWLENNKESFNDLSSNTGEVISNLFDINEVKDIPVDKLLNMSLNEVMAQFGNTMLSGNLNVYFKESQVLSANNQMQNLYQHLLDSGHLKPYCS